jgi:hypothetical protein
LKLNTEFAIDKLTPEEQAQVVATWQAGGIDFEEMRFLLRKSSLAYKDDKQAKEAIRKDQEQALQDEIKKIEAKKPPAGGTTNPTGATT